MRYIVATFPEGLSQCLIRLAGSRWSLLLVLLALDALLHPYATFHHDARLYAVQVLNRIQDGYYNHDLFFLHGNQDSYSLFSLVMAPLVAGLGLKASFFLVYLASKALFFYGCLRLFEALVEDRRASTLALLFVAITPLPYGGVETFHVNESFLTPRLTASAVVLLGLERLLARRWVVAAALLIVGLFLHPLMACGGVMIYILVLAGRCLSLRSLLLPALPAALAVAILLLRPDLGVRLLGEMDDEWRWLVLRRSPHCFPGEWTALDWARIVAAFGLVSIAATCLPSDRSRCCWAVAVAGVVGLAASWVAVEWPFALLLQGQPFRVLWIVQLLGLPLGFFVVFRLAAESRTFPQLLALFLLYFLTCNFDVLGRFVLLLLAVVPLLMVCLRGLDPTPRRADWLWLSTAGGAAIVFGLTLLSHVAGVAKEMTLLIDHFEPLLLAVGIPGALERPVLVGLTLIVVALLVRWLGTGPKLGVVMAGVWLGYQLLLLGIGEWDLYCKRYRRDYANMAFVQETLSDRLTAAEQPLTIYWPTDLNYLWFNLRANSYFNLMQTPGNIFSRETAVEADQRADRVCKFDLHYLRTLPLTVRTWQMAARNYPALPLYPTPDQEPAPPDRGDLRRLCMDEKLDYVVTLAPLGEDYVATNGKVYIYDGRRIREQAP
jgi:hypothetical protein